MSGTFADWLTLREPADAAARSTRLVAQLRDHLGGSSRTAGAQPARESRMAIHDLGAGTGSMCRWLAPLLPGPQHWVLYDRDPGLLALARARTDVISADGTPVTVETRQADITQLTAADLKEPALVTASALLDMLTAEQLDRIVAAVLDAGCPALVTLSVVGEVLMVPGDPFDGPIQDAFNAHQRRTVGGAALLGPDAVGYVTNAFRSRGARVEADTTVWRLGPAQAELAGAWFTGWVEAACEQYPELAPQANEYAGRRLAEIGAGRVRVLVHHRDILVTGSAHHGGETHFVEGE
ncbi:MAG: class I SAM-dependent methyltransferase [Micromonosporaceae bacterium]|nr:class I SAM-dependent methyltransferase [Micromonosporaceae bacterium]